MNIPPKIITNPAEFNAEELYLYNRFSEDKLLHQAVIKEMIHRYIRRDLGSQWTNEKFAIGNLVWIGKLGPSQKYFTQEAYAYVAYTSYNRDPKIISNPPRYGLILLNKLGLPCNSSSWYNENSLYIPSANGIERGREWIDERAIKRMG